MFRRVGCALVAMSIAFGAVPAGPGSARHPDITWFVQAAGPADDVARKAMDRLKEAWRDGDAALLVDAARFMRPPTARGAVVDPGSPIRRRLVRFLEVRTGQTFGQDLDAWRRWIWSLPYEPHPDYAIYKGGLYGMLDPRFREFFPEGVDSKIRLDQIDWGGVLVGGIPALDHPTIVTASDAGYLKDKDVVFGLFVNGEARAYPKRIMAWHELARDTVGGVDLALVYCTLCGTVIPWETRVGDVVHELDTSGLLYRSNKLMFDAQTKSLWSSVYGEPVVGALAGRDLQLKSRPVVTTTWKEWRETHPDTGVLSIDTGHRRDYRPGAAYGAYSRTDEPMFAVPFVDERLGNKAEVLVLAFTVDTGPESEPSRAISTRFLKKHRIHHLNHGEFRYVVLTTRQGASRVYRVGPNRFTRWVEPGIVADGEGGSWRVGEEALVRDADGTRLPRMPAHRAYWFGWYAADPDTELTR